MSFRLGAARCGRHIVSRPSANCSSWISLRHMQRRMLATATQKPLVSSSPGQLKFTYPDTTTSSLKRTSLPYFWLRDNCRCNACVNQDTRQRNFDTFNIPNDIQPSHIERTDGGVKVQWSGDGHQSFYSWDFLEFYLKFNGRTPEPIEIEYFETKESQNSHSWPPSLTYGEFSKNEDEAIGRLTNHIVHNGFVFITGVPSDSAESTQELLEKISFIRLTHYGGFYDFIPDLALADTAYTNLPLGAHTDGTYFSDPPGLQAFHLLSHTDNSSGRKPGESLGGQSLLVDGFKAANTLKKEDPEAFEVMSKVKLPWHASGNKGITISPDKPYPVFEVDDNTGKLHRIRWNNDDRGVVPWGEYSPEEWYRAAAKWNSILKRESMEYWFQLKPGNLLVFDNWRVLHGRSAFTGVRRICGAYINRDDFISRWRNTNYPREEILERIIG